MDAGPEGYDEDDDEEDDEASVTAGSRGTGTCPPRPHGGPLVPLFQHMRGHCRGPGSARLTVRTRQARASTCEHPSPRGGRGEEGPLTLSTPSLLTLTVTLNCHPE